MYDMREKIIEEARELAREKGYDEECADAYAQGCLKGYNCGYDKGYVVGTEQGQAWFAKLTTILLEKEEYGLLNEICKDTALRKEYYFLYGIAYPAVSRYVIKQEK